MKNSPIAIISRNKGSSVWALVVAAFIFAISVPQVQAFGGGSGNPFGNGSFFSNEGTFQATIRGLNLSGVSTFSTGSSASGNSTSSSGSFEVIYEGTGYTGNVDANIDAASSSIAAAMEASVVRGGNGTSTTTLSSNYTVTGTSSNGTAVVNLPDLVVTTTSDKGNGTITTDTTTTTGRTEVISIPSDVAGWVDTIATSTYQDTSYVAGSYTAKLKNSYPNQIFAGSGAMAFTGIDFTLAPPALVTETVAVSVKGVRISDTAQDYTAQAVQAPSVITTTTLENRGAAAQ